MKISVVLRSILAAAVIGTGFASGAAAATLDILGAYTRPPGSTTGSPNRYYDSSFLRAQLTCSLGCEGLLSTEPSGLRASGFEPLTTTYGGWSTSVADLFDAGSSSDANEVGFINTVTGGGYTYSGPNPTAVKDDSPSTTFTSSAEYILFKIGQAPDVFLIRNLVAGNVFTYNNLSGSGGGLSHMWEAGEIEMSPVPLPAGLPLLAGGLALLGLVRRKRA